MHFLAKNKSLLVLYLTQKFATVFIAQEFKETSSGYAIKIAV